MAIGAQNAFGLRKGLRRHVLLVVWVWAGSDLSLILAVSRRLRRSSTKRPCSASLGSCGSRFNSKLATVPCCRRTSVGWTQWSALQIFDRRQPNGWFGPTCSTRHRARCPQQMSPPRCWAGLIRSSLGRPETARGGYPPARPRGALIPTCRRLEGVFVLGAVHDGSPALPSTLGREGEISVPLWGYPRLPPREGWGRDGAPRRVSVDGLR